jgi:hypothetical protein
MVSSTFAFRFKNKIGKLGKDGSIPLNKSNFINKISIPSKKLHYPLLQLLPSVNKVTVSQNILKEYENKIIPNSKCYRSYTPKRYQIISKTPPNKLRDNIKKSISPYVFKEIRLYTEPIKGQNSLSYPKLPRVNSSNFNFNKNLKTIKNIINKLKNQ